MISILFFLWNSLMLILAGFTREYNTIIISDNNREKIISLIEENLDCYKEIPDISIAKKIERTALMHKDEITIYYEDEKNYNFFIDNTYNNPFISYIQNEGYNNYFQSSEFIVDLIKTIISFIISVGITVILIQKKPNSNL